jgi:hypothetical protein
MKKLVTAFAVVFVSCSFAFAQQKNIDLNQFIRETQKNIGNSNNIKMAWWIPTEFWKISFQNAKDMTAEQKQQFLTLIEPYTIFGVVEGQTGAFGGVTYRTEVSMNDSIVLIDCSGNMHKPVESQLLDPNVANLLAMMKPVLKNVMGQLGENFNFFVFNNKQGSKKLLDPHKEGAFSLTVFHDSFKWQLPLATLMPPKICPTDNAEMNGNWNFCPFHGTKLKLAETSN